MKLENIKTLDDFNQYVEEKNIAEFFDALNIGERYYVASFKYNMERHKFIYYNINEMTLTSKVVDADNDVYVAIMFLEGDDCRFTLGAMGGACIFNSMTEANMFANIMENIGEPAYVSLTMTQDKLSQNANAYRQKLK